MLNGFLGRPACHDHDYFYEFLMNFHQIGTTPTVAHQPRPLRMMYQGIFMSKSWIILFFVPPTRRVRIKI